MAGRARTESQLNLLLWQKFTPAVGTTESIALRRIIPNTLTAMLYFKMVPSDKIGLVKDFRDYCSATSASSLRRVATACVLQESHGAALADEGDRPGTPIPGARAGGKSRGGVRSFDPHQRDEEEDEDEDEDEEGLSRAGFTRFLNLHLAP